MGNFEKVKAGDWVRVLHTDYIVRVDSVDSDGSAYLKTPDGKRSWFFYSSEFEPWTPKVGATTPTAIVCLIEDGQPKPATLPFVHATVESANTEASRLANKHKSQKFGVYVLTGEPVVVKLDHEWQRLAANGNKIGAIKELRDKTGMGLKPAKDAVEYFLAAA